VKGPTRNWIFTHYSPIHSAEANKKSARYFRDHRYKLYSDGRFYDVVADNEETQPIPAGKGTAAAEKARKVFEAELAKLPAWKLGDPGVAKVILPGLEPEASFSE
jgi:arylsulfatase A